MNSGEASPLLRHVDLFGLTTSRAVERIWKERGLERLQEHVASGELAICGELPGRALVYERTREEVSSRRHIQEQQLLYLSFCLLGTTERRPITGHKVREIYPDFASGARHCVESGEAARLWRIFSPTTAAADVQTARHIRQAHLHALKRLPRESSFREMVLAGSYGFAVLMTDEKRASALRELLHERPLPPEVPLLVEVIPEQNYRFTAISK